MDRIPAGNGRNVYRGIVVIGDQVLHEDVEFVGGQPANSGTKQKPKASLIAGLGLGMLTPTSHENRRGKIN
jgi:hypothetical protein